MSVKGIVLDESNMNQIRACGFTDFTVDPAYPDEIDEGEDEYQDWCNDQLDKICNFSEEYMVGMEDAKYFFFSDKQPVIDKIAEVFPGCDVVTVSDDDLNDIYSLDYDYREEQ